MNRDEWHNSPTFKLHRLINNRSHEIIQVTQQLSDMFDLLVEKHPDFVSDKWTIAQQQLRIISMDALNLTRAMDDLIRTLEPKKFDDDSETIEKLELEKIGDYRTGDWLCTVFYKLIGEDSETKKVKFTIDDMDYMEKINVCDAMFHVGRILGLENDNTGTLDFNLCKDVPDEWLEANKHADLTNPLVISQAPGRSFWLATGYRP